MFDESERERLNQIAKLEIDDLKDRLERKETLNEHLVNWTSKQDTTKLIHMFQEFGICASVMNK